MKALPLQLSCYRPSGAAPAAGILAIFAGGIAAGIVLGAVYAFTNHHDPILYLNIALVFLFGWALGTIVSKGIRSFRIRSRAAAAIIGLAVFAAAYFSHWCVYIPTVLADYDKDISSYDVPVILEAAVELVQYPEEAWKWIRRLNERGVWTMTSPGSSTPGLEIKGMSLGLIWLAEAVILCYYSVKTPWNEAGKPYSERQGKWLDAKELPARIAFIENEEEFLNALARNDYSALTAPLPEGEKSARHAKYAAVTLYSDSFEPYVTVKNVSISGRQAKQAGGLGKKIMSRLTASPREETSARDVVRYLKITPTTAQNISSALGSYKAG
jgi:hypothetical protein